MDIRGILRRRRRTHAGGSEGLPDVQASQWWDRSEIAEYQARRVRWMISYVWEEIPFYRRWLRRHGVRPSTIQGPDDLAAIPPVTRAVAQRAGDRMLNPAEVAERAISGGTTGHRLQWARNTEWLELFTACLWRGFGWAGLDPDKRVVSFYSRVVGRVAREALILREAFDTRTIEDDLRRVEAFRPQVGYCYASSADLVARYLLDNGRTLPLEAMITTSEPLFPHQAANIEAAFECHVYDNYGCNDGGAWGAQCAERTGFHHDVERSVVQFVDGRMVTTDLWNTAFPFVRYENGDAGGWIDGDCPCGRRSPRFGIAGRTQDLLVTPTSVVAPTTVSQLLLYDGIDDVRVIQRSRTDVEVVYVPNHRFTSDGFAPTRSALTELLEGMDVRFVTASEIPATASGKHRTSINASGISPDALWRR